MFYNEFLPQWPGDYLFNRQNERQNPFSQHGPADHRHRPGRGRHGRGRYGRNHGHHSNHGAFENKTECVLKIFKDGQKQDDDITVLASTVSEIKEILFDMALALPLDLIIFEADSEGFGQFVEMAEDIPARPYGILSNLIIKVQIFSSAPEPSGVESVEEPVEHTGYVEMMDKSPRGPRRHSPHRHPHDKHLHHQDWHHHERPHHDKHHEQCHKRMRGHQHMLAALDKISQQLSSINSHMTEVRLTEQKGDNSGLGSMEIDPTVPDLKTAFTSALPNPMFRDSVRRELGFNVISGTYYTIAKLELDPIPAFARSLKAMMASNKEKGTLTSGAQEQAVAQ